VTFVNILDLVVGFQLLLYQAYQLLEAVLELLGRS
jgi:hypothetical protein